MRILAVLLAFMAFLAAPAHTEEAPLLAGLVKEGKLPPQADRLPKEPRVMTIDESTGRTVGKRGGTIRTLMAEKHAVYRRYLRARHDGSMSGSAEEFDEFLHRAPEMTREVVFRAAGRFVGAGIFDVAKDALSAVYFYFDPELAAR